MCIRDRLTPELGIPQLQERIEWSLPISVLLFGMGADMHTASLFPDGDNLEEALSSNAPTLLPMRAAGALEARITLTAQVLNSSRIKHLVIFGDEKRAAFERRSTYLKALRLFQLFCQAPVYTGPHN